jgi:hypothetical protein
VTRPPAVVKAPRPASPPRTKIWGAPGVRFEPLTVRSFILGIPLGQPLHWRCRRLACQPYSHAQVRVAGCWLLAAALGAVASLLLVFPGATGQPPGVLSQTVAASGSADAISLLLGRLRVQDETLLREPFLGMRLAEAAIVARQDALAADDLSRWSDVFRGRLDGMTIPDGTRADLARLVAAYEHEARNVPGQAQAGTAMNLAAGAAGTAAMIAGRSDVPAREP